MGKKFRKTVTKSRLSLAAFRVGRAGPGIPSRCAQYRQAVDNEMTHDMKPISLDKFLRVDAFVLEQVIEQVRYLL